MIYFSETREMWNEETKAVCCSSISFRPAGVYTVMSTEPKPSISITVFPVYIKSSSEAGVTVKKYLLELHTCTIAPESRMKLSQRL